MNPFRTTGLVSLFVILLAAYTAWDYKKAQKPEDNPQEKALYSLKREDVTRIQLTRGADVIRVEKNGEHWQVKQPVDDLADPGSVEVFLFSLFNQKAKIFRSEDESKATKWADFGLEPPSVSIELTAGGKSESIAVGSKNAYDGAFYLRQGDELLLGDHAMAQSSRRDANSFRSRRLWRLDDAETEAAELQIGAETLKFKKLDGKWTLDPAPKFAVDSEKIGQYLTNIKQIPPSEIAAENLTEENKRQLLLLKPAMVVTLHLNNKKDWTLTVGQDRAEDVFLTVSDRPTVYKTLRANIDKVRVGKEFFRDGGKAFKFPLEQAREVRIHSEGFAHTFKKDGSTWKVADGSGDTLVEGKLEAFFTKLGQLEARDFTAAGKGFKPGAGVQILGEGGKTLLDLSWGEDYKAKQVYNKGMTFRFVKTNLEKDVMGVEAGKISALIDTSMVKKSAPPPKAVTK